MAPRDTKPRPEQEQTDRSLREEREHTDEAYQRKQDAIEEDADSVLERARTRADSVVEKARARADARLASSSAPQQDLSTVQSERVQADVALRQERATAGTKLLEEREAGRRALASLLRLERETTDAHLLVERVRSDEVLTARDDFLGMVSHDLRTLLGGIAMNAAMLLKDVPADAPGEATRRRAEAIQRFTARMNRLIGDLLDVTSIEAGRLAVQPQPDDAIRLVRETMEAFQPSASAHGLTLDALVARDSLLARFDHERVLQVLANLVSNALKFTPEGGRVSIHVEPVGADVRFSVSDTGPGIPADTQEHVFERFWQVPGVDRRGLGLGLYISRCIVEAHGGRIWVESVVGQGSTFRFTLPGARGPG